MMKSNKLSARPIEVISNDKVMKNLQPAKDATTKPPMPIPQELLDLADKMSTAYKEYISRSSVSMETSKPSRPTPETHKKLDSSTNLGLETGSTEQGIDKGGKRRREYKDLLTFSSMETQGKKEMFK
jgi:hypothetical protein